MMPLLTMESITGTAAMTAGFAMAASPDSSAVRAFLMAVRIFERSVMLCARRVTACLARLTADLMLAKGLLQTIYIQAAYCAKLSALCQFY
jgi:hypothetical protein